MSSSRFAETLYTLLSQNSNKTKSWWRCPWNSWTEDKGTDPLQRPKTPWNHQGSYLDLSRQSDAELTFVIRNIWPLTDLWIALTHIPSVQGHWLKVPQWAHKSVHSSRISHTPGRQTIVMTGTSKEEFEKQTSLIKYILIFFFCLCSLQE